MGNMGDTVDSRRVQEFSETPAELDDKLNTLVEMVKASKNTIFFTGAGISTAAGISDYRGPTGVWTRQRVKKLKAKAAPSAAEKAELALLIAEAKKKGDKGKARGGFGLTSAEPTLSHMAMATLVSCGQARHVVTTNLDGLHRKSGLQHHKTLTCLHGDIYIERCTACGHEEERDYHVRNNAPRKLNVHDHSIGTCNKCGSKPPKSYTGKKGANGCRKTLVNPRDKNKGTKDTHINFGESLDDIDWDEAEKACAAADLCIVVGTSMSLSHVTHMPFMAKKTVICNLQKTPYDDKADLRIFAYADPVLIGVMERLALKIDPTPEPKRCVEPKRHAVLPGVHKGGEAQNVVVPPASAKSMRAHITATQAKIAGSSGVSKVQLTVEPAPFGVSVRGREVVKVVPGSQAEALGVKVGWLLTSIQGQEMPMGGQAAADAITHALASGKRGTKPYTIICHRPASANRSTLLLPKKAKTPPGKLSSSSGTSPKVACGGNATQAVADVGRQAIKAAAFGGAFGSFSTGLGSTGLSSKLMQAHSTMLGMSQGLMSLETSASAC